MTPATWEAAKVAVTAYVREVLVGWYACPPPRATAGQRRGALRVLARLHAYKVLAVHSLPAARRAEIEAIADAAWPDPLVFGEEARS